MNERQYDKAIRLVGEVTKSLADLGDLLKSPIEENLTKDEQKDLQMSLIKLIVVIKEFSKGETKW